MECQEAFLQHEFVIKDDDSGTIRHRFGRAIRRRRRELDLSQEKLAELAKLHPTYVSGIERGERNPTLENIEKLTIALGITVSDLFVSYGIEPQDQRSDHE